MTPSPIWQPWQLRAAFARHVSALYGREVPAYTTLVEVTSAVNADVVEADGVEAERLGSIDRVTAERHGAIRVGTPSELAQMARIFAAMGMHPTGWYDLRDPEGGRAGVSGGIPVVATAFRPVEAVALSRNPFRVFVSLLAVDDRRYFDADLAARLQTFLGSRTLFPARLLALADRGEEAGGLVPAEAEEFLDLAGRALALSPEPIDAAWYAELEAVSAVAADIGGMRSTHVNHLTPRVLDIDELYRRMSARGISMIDEIQGPPRWEGPDVLLRQTSFRALAEPRRFRQADGTLTTGSLRVRFGEVEARGIALTRSGRALYDDLVAEVDRRLAAAEGPDRQGVAEQVWRERMPGSEDDLVTGDVGVFTFTVDRDPARHGRLPGPDLATLLEEGWLRAEPVVYEDFLPRSAAGIFRSNLDGETSARGDRPAALLDAAWLEGALGRPLLDPDELYADRRGVSLHAAAAALGLQAIAVPSPHTEPRRSPP